jgi:hypothetical protein
VVKPAIKPNTSKPNSTTNAITNALTGAALGAGTKLIIDKITGKPTAVKTDAPVEGQPKTSSGSGSSSGQPRVSSGTASSPINSNSAKVAAANSAARKAQEVKAAEEARKKAAAASGPTSVVKPPVGVLGIPKDSIDNGDGTYTSQGLTFDMKTNMPLYRDNAAGGVDVVKDNNDGTYTIGNTTYSMENDSVLYTTDASGKITVPSSGGASSGDAGVVNNETSSYTGKDISIPTPVIGPPVPPLNRGLGSGREISGTVENDDGTTTLTFADGSTETLDGNFDVVGTTPADGAGDDGEISADLEGGSGAKETVVVETDPEFFQDDDGNIYIMNADGGYELAYYADGSAYEDTYTDDSEDTTFADNTYYDEESGQTWNLSDSGMWTLEGDEPTDYGDSLYADNTDYTSEDDFLYAGNDYDSNYYDYPDYSDYNDYSDYGYAKRGGLITMMKHGGNVQRFDTGGYVDNGDGTYQVGNDVYDMMTNDRLYSLNDGAVENVNNKYVYYSGDSPEALPSGAVDNGDGTYSIGRFTYDMMTDEYMYSTDNGQITNVSPDFAYSTGDGTEPYYSTDSLGNVFRDGEFYRAAEVPEDITSAGGGNRNWYDDYVKPLVSGGQRLASDALSGITGALGTTAGAAGAGALVATLLGQDFSGGTGNQNQGLDMSQVGVINPRTTDFGIGPTRFVGYEDYGTGGDDYAPNEELLRNLNAPGFNPVN